MSRPASSDPAIPPAANRHAPARALTERQMAVLTRLTEIGMVIAEAAGQMASAIAAGGGTGADALDPSLAFSRAARAVRLTIALQSRLVADEEARGRAKALERVAEVAQRRRRIHAEVEAAIETERGDGSEFARLSWHAWERLTDEDESVLLDRPVAEVVADICRDLGLSPAFGAVAPTTLDGARGPPSQTPSFSGLARESSCTGLKDRTSRPKPDPADDRGLESRATPQNDEKSGDGVCFGGPPAPILPARAAPGAPNSS